MHVCVMCVCPPLRLLITSGMICTPYDLLSNFYSFYMAAVVDIVSRHSLSIDAHILESILIEISQRCISHYIRTCVLSLYQLFKIVVHK